MELALEELGVLDSLLWRVDRARTDNDEYTVIVVLDDRRSGMACSGNRQAGLSGGLDICSGKILVRWYRQ